MSESLEAMDVFSLERLHVLRNAAMPPIQRSLDR